MLRPLLSSSVKVDYIRQDYQYLKYYSRAYGLVLILRSLTHSINTNGRFRSLLVAKSRRFVDIKPAADTIQNVIREVSMHKAFCETLGVSETELESTPESSATTAYGAYLLDCGLQGRVTIMG